MLTCAIPTTRNTIKGDGNCAAPGCDVGSVPVGEYLFDHRSANVSVNNQTFIEWFLDDYFGGQAGIGNENIIGFYIDDDWGTALSHRHFIHSRNEPCYGMPRPIPPPRNGVPPPYPCLVSVALRLRHLI